MNPRPNHLFVGFTVVVALLLGAVTPARAQGVMQQLSAPKGQ